VEIKIRRSDFPSPGAYLRLAISLRSAASARFWPELDFLPILLVDRDLERLVSTAGDAGFSFCSFSVSARRGAGDVVFPAAEAGAVSVAATEAGRERRRLPARGLGAPGSAVPVAAPGAVVAARFFFFLVRVLSLAASSPGVSPRRRGSGVAGLRGVDARVASTDGLDDRSSRSGGGAVVALPAPGARTFFFFLRSANRGRSAGLSRVAGSTRRDAALSPSRSLMRTAVDSVDDAAVGRAPELSLV